MPRLSSSEGYNANDPVDQLLIAAGIPPGPDTSQRALNVVQAYQTAFGRMPDVEGFKNYVTEPKALDVNAMVAEMANSPEGQQKRAKDQQATTQINTDQTKAADQKAAQTLDAETQQKIKDFRDGLTEKMTTAYGKLQKAHTQSIDALQSKLDTLNKNRDTKLKDIDDNINNRWDAVTKKLETDNSNAARALALKIKAIQKDTTKDIDAKNKDLKAVWDQTSSKLASDLKLSTDQEMGDITKYQTEATTETEQSRKTLSDAILKANTTLDQKTQSINEGWNKNLQDLYAKETERLDLNSAEAKTYMDQYIKPQIQAIQGEYQTLQQHAQKTIKEAFASRGMLDSGSNILEQAKSELGLGEQEIGAETGVRTQALGERFKNIVGQTRTQAAAYGTQANTQMDAAMKEQAQAIATATGLNAQDVERILGFQQQKVGERQTAGGIERQAKTGAAMGGFDIMKNATQTDIDLLKKSGITNEQLATMSSQDQVALAQKMGLQGFANYTKQEEQKGSNVMGDTAMGTALAERGQKEGYGITQDATLNPVDVYAKTGQDALTKGYQTGMTGMNQNFDVSKMGLNEDYKISDTAAKNYQSYLDNASAIDYAKKFQTEPSFLDQVGGFLKNSAGVIGPLAGRLIGGSRASDEVIGGDNKVDQRIKALQERYGAQNAKGKYLDKGFV